MSSYKCNKVYIFVLKDISGTRLKSIHVIADSEIREFIKESETSRVPRCLSTRDEKYHVISPLETLKENKGQVILEQCHIQQNITKYTTRRCFYDVTTSIRRCDVTWAL